MIADPEIRNRTLVKLAALEAYRTSAGAGLNVADLIEDPDARSQALREVAVAAARAGEFRKAFNISQEITVTEERVLALSQLAREQARLGNESAAQDLLQSAESNLGEVDGTWRGDRLLGKLAIAYADVGNPDYAAAKIDEISQANQQDAFRQQVAISLARRGEFDAAQDLAMEIKREELRGVTMVNIANQIARTVPPEEALNHVRKLETPSQQVQFLLGVAQRT
jgi:serine protease Do